MTYALNLNAQTVKRVKEKAQKAGVAPQQWLETIIQNASQESKSDEEFEAAMNRIFDRYEKAFEVLSEGAK